MTVLQRYGVATISRLLKIIGLFCKRALQKRLDCVNPVEHSYVTSCPCTKVFVDVTVLQRYVTSLQQFDMNLCNTIMWQFDMNPLNPLMWQCDMDLCNTVMLRHVRADDDPRISATLSCESLRYVTSQDNLTHEFVHIPRHHIHTRTHIHTYT